MKKITIFILFILICTGIVIFIIVFKPWEKLNDKQVKQNNEEKNTHTIMKIDSEDFKKWTANFKTTPQLYAYKAQGEIFKVDKKERCSDYSIMIKAADPISSNYKEEYNDEITFNSCEAFSIEQIVDCHIKVLTKKASTEIDYIEYSCPALKANTFKKYIK